MREVDTSTWARRVTSDGGLSVLVPADWQPEPPADDYVLAASPVGQIDPIVVVTREGRPEGCSGANDYMSGNVIRLQQDDALRDYRDGGGGQWTIDGQAIAWHAYAHTTGANRQRMRVAVFYVVSADAAYATSCLLFEKNAPRLEPTVMTIGRSLRLVGGR